MTNHSYSANIANAIRRHLDEHTFKYSFDENRGVFTMLMGVNTKAKTLIYHLIVHDHGFTSSARYPLGPSSSDEACMNTMARFLTRANYALRNGNFEMDMDDGEINFKSYCNCRGLSEPTDKMVEESIQCPAAMFDKYEEGLLGILFQGMSDKEANERCERGQGSLLSKLEELKAHLEAMRAEKEGSGEEQSPAAEDSDDDGPSLSFDEFLRMLADHEEEEDDDDEDDDDIIDAD